MRDARNSDTSVNELLTEGHAESPMALPSSPKLKIIKTGNELNNYVSNFTHDEIIQNKNNLSVYFKRNLIFKVKEFNFYFLFKKRARFKFFLRISNKVVPYSWTSYRYPATNFG